MRYTHVKPGTRGFGRSIFGLPALGSDGTVPWWCWNNPGFKDCNTLSWQRAEADCPQDENFVACKAATANRYTIEDCVPQCGPQPATGTCTSAAVIKQVQAALNAATSAGLAVDGIWGPKSAAALTASGSSFAALAPSCTGTAPGGASTRSGGVAAAKKITATTTKTPAPPPKKAGLFGLPTVMWVGVASVAGVLLLLTLKKSTRHIDEEERRSVALRGKAV